MAERRSSKESKWNEGEEGTDGSKQKGGGGGKDHEHKRSKIGGAAHFVHKRVTGQPKSTPKKKDGKRNLSSFDKPTPPSSLAQEASQQQLGSTWSPTKWQWDTKQPAPVASGTVTPSTEEATPPTDDDDDDDDLTSFGAVVIPQQSSDNPELSLKLARIELENERHKRELKDKRRQIKEYEEEIIKLRTQMSRSGGGGGGVQAVVDQSITQKLTHTIQQLEREKEELMKGKEELEREKDQLAKKLEERELMGKVEITEFRKEKERELAEVMVAVEREKKKKEGLQKELNDTEANRIEQLQLQHQYFMHQGTKKGLITQGNKEENEIKGNDYEQRISQLTKSLSEKEKDLTDLKEKAQVKNVLLMKRLKEKDKACNEQEAIKLQLESELAAAKEEVILLKELLYSSKELEKELKEKIRELEKEMNKKFERLQLKETRMKHLEELLSEKEKSVFNVEGSDAADKRDRELMIKQMEDLKKESERNIAEATRHINELEEVHKEQLKEINKLREENTVLKATVEEQGNMRERLTELEELFDKVAANHEKEMNHIRRKEETKRVELEEKWKRKFEEESEQRTQSHVQEMNETMEAVKKKYKDRLQAREEELQAQLDKFSQENKELKEHLYNREEVYSLLQDSLDRKSVISMELEKQLQDIMKHSAEKDQKLEEISERLALKETENELFKQDFESERKDRKRINDQLIKLQTQLEILKQESAEKEREAQMKFHNLKQSKSTLMHDLEKSRKEIATKGAEIESLVQKNAQLEKQHTEETRKIQKKLQESEQGETDKIKGMEEDLMTLTAQVNAYCREVDRQKGLVTQSQEKHKTEVHQLIKKLDDEMKSKQQLANELARMRQQLDNVSRANQLLDIELSVMRQQLDDISTDKEELLRAYHEEQAMVTRLEDQIEKMKKANIVLKDKVVASRQAQSELNRLHGVERQLSSKQEEVISLQQILSGFQNAWELSHREVSLLEELGRGGYGVVWVGHLRVAVKKLHEWIVSQHNKETFHHEINIMSQLRHPNLLQFIGAVLDHPSGCPMIVTEVMDTSLRKAYESKKLTPDPGCRPVILSIMNDVAEGLNYLHYLPDPIIHRDVSSANVLLQSIGPRKWKAKVSDFGSAKLAEKAITEGPGAFVYSAPEAFQSIASHDFTKKQTTKMDVFSYGVLLCEIITCRFPNRVNFQDMLLQVHSISNRPSDTRNTQGSLLHSLIVSCCHDDPYRRPTMKEIIEQLDIISK